MFSSAYKIKPFSYENVDYDNSKEPVFSERITESGIYEVYQSGEKNLQDIINAAYEDTKIYNILAKCGIGDYTGMSAQPFFGDITGYPTNIHEAVGLAKNIKGFYDKLPKEEKATFGSFKEFMEASTKKDFLKKFEKNTKKEDPKPKENTTKKEE